MKRDFKVLISHFFLSNELIRWIIGSSFITLVIFVACKKEKKCPIEYYTSVDTLSVISDSKTPYLFMPKSMIFSTNNEMWLLDVGNNRILQLSKDHKLIREFGSKGRGPGEFLYPSTIRIRGDNLYVADPGINRFSVFDTSGKYKGGFICPSGVGDDFVVSSNGLIYILARSQKALIKAYNEEGRELLAFGELISDQDLQLSRILSAAYLEIDDKDCIYVAFIQSPFIRKYTAQGKLLWEKDLKKFPELNKIFSMTKERRERNPTQRYNIFQMCIGTYFADSTFFVGYIGVIPYGNTVYCFGAEGQLNKVLRISRGDIPIESLPDAWDLAVSPDHYLWLAERGQNHRILKFER